MTLHFGECPYCDGYIERPFWDVCCFNCQDDIDEENAERDERMREEDHFLYTIPSKPGEQPVSHGQLPAPNLEQLLEPDPEMFLAGGPLAPDPCECEAICTCGEDE